MLRSKEISLAPAGNQTRAFQPEPLALLRWFIIDIDTILWYLHPVDVGSVVFSEVHVIPNFRAKVTEEAYISETPETLPTSIRRKTQEQIQYTSILQI
jgi:hypothetical protein